MRVQTAEHSWGWVNTRPVLPFMKENWEEEGKRLLHKQTHHVHDWWWWIHSPWRPQFCLPHLPPSWGFSAPGCAQQLLQHNSCSSPWCKGLLRFYSRVVVPVGQALYLQCSYLQETLRKQDESAMFILPQNKHNRSSCMVQSPEGMRGQTRFCTDHPANPWKACWSLAGKGNIHHDFFKSSKEAFPSSELF